MKKHFLNLALVALVVVSATSCKDNKAQTETEEAKEVSQSTAAATTFNVDTEKSVIHWTGTKPTGSHTGTIQLKSGTIAAANRDIQSGTFTIAMTSLKNTDLEGGMKDSLEAHLKGTAEGKEPDFFNVTKYPNATFALTGVTGTGGNVVVEGNLTIKDKTHNVSFPAVVSFPGDTMFLKSKEFTIDRTNWGINFKSKSILDDLKEGFINDEVTLSIELHATKA